MMTLLLSIATEWCQIDKRKFGIGNISKANGPQFKPHHSHRLGLEVDVRPLRVDGKELACKYLDPGYDRAATTRLISLFVRHPLVNRVLFNDPTIPNVRRAPDHDNHFHVELIR